MRSNKFVLLTFAAALTADVIVPHDYNGASLTQIVPPTQPALPVQPDHDHQPVEGEGPTTLAVGFQASGTYTNTAAATIAKTWSRPG